MPGQADTTPLPGLSEALSRTAAEFCNQAYDRLATDPARALPELLPRLPRRIGRDAFATGIHERDGARIDLAAWRCCDAVAYLFLQAAAAGDEQLIDLYRHGDMEEKTMVLRATTLRPISDATVELLGEAQRTNVVTHYEALVCDCNLVTRALQHQRIERADFDRAILKLAFMDLPLARVLDAETQASGELSRMLQDLATEREAAGRRVWFDTNRMIAVAPTAGTMARLAGGLEHGSDAHRLAAAEGLQHVNDATLLALVRERLPREPVPAIRSLESALQSAEAGPNT